MCEHFRLKLTNPRSHTHQILYNPATPSPQEAHEKISRSCDVFCEIFSVEHFVTAEEAEAAAAAVTDDSNRGNAQRCVSPIDQSLLKSLKDLWYIQ